MPAARETALWIGTLNTALLITSSFAYALGVAFIRVGNVRGLIQLPARWHCCWPRISGAEVRAGMAR